MDTEEDRPFHTQGLEMSKGEAGHPCRLVRNPVNVINEEEFNFPFVFTPRGTASHHLFDLHN